MGPALIAPIEVRLSEDEVRECHRVAKARVEASRSYKQKHGYNGRRFAIDLPGAAGECAGHKGLGLVWTGSVGTFKLPDARHNIQFRTAPRYGSMIVRPDDDRRDYYVLVQGKLPDFWIMGWMLGLDARREMWIRAPNRRPPAWFVPASALHLDFSEIL